VETSLGYSVGGGVNEGSMTSGSTYSCSLSVVFEELSGSGWVSFAAESESEFVPLSVEMFKGTNSPLAAKLTEMGTSV
jgi:hypothetical protein